MAYEREMHSFIQPIINLASLVLSSLNREEGLVVLLALLLCKAREWIYASTSTLTDKRSGLSTGMSVTQLADVSKSIQAILPIQTLIDAS